MRAAHATFCFDLGSPEAYLVAERILHELPVQATWEPVLGDALRTVDAPSPAHRSSGSTASGRPDAIEARRQAIELRAAAQAALPLRWPAPFPFDSTVAMVAATYAKQIGRTVAFALAAFRQAFAAGRSLSEVDNILIAAAACEMHPKAVLQAIERVTVAQALESTALQASSLGVRSVPAIVLDGRVFEGIDALDRALAAIP